MIRHLHFSIYWTLLSKVPLINITKNESDVIDRFSLSWNVVRHDGLLLSLNSHTDLHQIDRKNKREKKDGKNTGGERFHLDRLSMGVELRNVVGILA